VAAQDLAGMRAVHERTGIAVMADEAVCSVLDAEAVAAAGAAQIFNVRPGKHGGLLGSLAIVQRARAAGIGVHLGTLVGESGLLSRVAEVFGRCVAGFACLDGKGQNRFLLEEDVLAAPADDADNPAVAAPLHAPGLGVDVLPAAIARHRLGQPVQLRAAG
jgi:L-alanine-DL-glutamate epimerase-like enolase superfamily enzyme